VRWIQRMQEYNFTSEHRQGRKHNNANALSRRPCHNVEERAEIIQVGGIAAVAEAYWDPATLRTEQ
jgi:hypothetical protein